MLTKITFTGIDNKTKIKDLEELYKKYPFVEFGFLVSESNTNKRTVNIFWMVNQCCHCLEYSISGILKSLEPFFDALLSNAWASISRVFT